MESWTNFSFELLKLGKNTQIGTWENWRWINWGPIGTHAQCQSQLNYVWSRNILCARTEQEIRRRTATILDCVSLRRCHLKWKMQINCRRAESSATIIVICVQKKERWRTNSWFSLRELIHYFHRTTQLDIAVDVRVSSLCMTHFTLRAIFVIFISSESRRGHQYSALALASKWTRSANRKLRFFV